MAIEVNVMMNHAGFVTGTVRRQRAACTYDPKKAVERLADKLFPYQQVMIERLEMARGAGQLHSKWRITPEVK